MTVKELREELEKYPDQTKIYIEDREDEITYEAEMNVVTYPNGELDVSHFILMTGRLIAF